MKKIFAVVMLCMVILSAAACGSEPAAAPANNDLSAMSQTDAYAELCRILLYPEDYVGQELRLSGEYLLLEIPETGRTYHICLLYDPNGDEPQAMEFVLADPSAYPVNGDTITICGRLETYDEDGYPYYHLADAELS